MQPGQKMVGANGYENFLFPLTTLYLTQEIGGDFSHKGTYAMDCVEYINGHQVLKAPYYAPFSGTNIWTLGNSGSSVWQSDRPVNMPLGTDYARILFYHDDTPPAVGTHLNQGDLLGHTGTNGWVTGDHVHIETARGTHSGYQLEQNSYGNWMLIGSTYPYDCMYLNNTTFVNPMNYPWKYASTTPPPPVISELYLINQVGKNYTFKGTSYANGNAVLKNINYSIKLGSIIISSQDIPYNSANYSSTYSWNSFGKTPGTYTITMTVTDSYGQKTSRNYNFIVKSNDNIIPLYMMNIINGGYNPIR